MEKVLPCITCCDYGLENGCPTCGFQTQDLFYKNPERPDCKKCYGLGGYGEPCQECGRQNCEVEVDGEYCSGYGISSICPTCEQMYPLYTPSVPDLDIHFKLERIAKMAETDSDMAELALQGLSNNKDGWIPATETLEKKLSFYISKGDKRYGTLADMLYNDSDEAWEMLMTLRKILEKEGLTEECENPECHADWGVTVTEPPYNQGRERISLFSDGGDAFQPSCLFLRSNDNGQYVHVPLKKYQKRLTEAAYELSSHWIGDAPNAQLVLDEYLSHVLNLNIVWRKIDFKEGSK